MLREEEWSGVDRSKFTAALWAYLASALLLLRTQEYQFITKRLLVTHLSVIVEEKTGYL